ncbi:unnamed protein product [Rotaria sordida]|uniref:Galectin n=1 Tax=Rotaria sordida TaxID=392033 RepID=A0A815JL53_9BILA|nr:unnamed protein product [Rotaria sordida]CAF0966981.1 unnamed protein product [Rotaria sordida]CAF1383856.1 unnamed protein product [Rotaria sordida]CAF3698500.1 unnamed protein product [Rotaria sordida]
MCHLILLTLPYSNHKIIIISIILFCDGYHLCFYPVHGQNQNIWLTNYTEKIPSKLIPKDEIIILGVLVEPFFYIDLIIDTENRPFHLKSLDTMIVFNSMHKGHWFDEITLIPNPLIGNISFMISIVINEDEGFNISFNEQKFFKFKKRKPLDVMKQIHIYGNLILKSVKIIHSSKEEDNPMKTLIIGIAITLALLIIVGLIFFYLLRRHCTRSKSKTKQSRKGHDSTIASLGSRRSKKTDNSNVTYLTGSSFLFT